MINNLLKLFVSDVYASNAFTWIGKATHGLHLPGMNHENLSHLSTFLFVGIMIAVWAVLYRLKLAKVDNPVIPDRGFSLRNMTELYGEFIYGQCKQIIGEKYGPKYFHFIASIFLLILISNLMGLIPGFLPPTESLNLTLALGIFSFVFYNIIGMQETGVWNYIKHFMGPLWYLSILIFPIEIISHMVRPLSLALRLRSNLMGDHIILEQFSNLVPFGVPIIFMVLGILVALVQAYVFSALTMVYINMAVASHDHGDEAH